MQVFDLSPINESRKTCVNLLALNGRCAPFLPRARIHSFRASSDLLISAPSIPSIRIHKVKNKCIYSHFKLYCKYTIHSKI